MKNLFIVPVFALLLIALPGCVLHSGMRQGGVLPSNSASNVLLLDSPPAWNYAEIGYVQSQGFVFAPDVAIYRGLQLEAAKIGADAVIPSIAFKDYKGRGEDDMLGRVIKGTAIVRVK